MLAGLTALSADSDEIRSMNQAEWIRMVRGLDQPELLDLTIVLMSQLYREIDDTIRGEGSTWDGYLSEVSSLIEAGDIR